MTIKNRITGSGVEDPAQLLANPFNFRFHPEHQQKALAGVLDEIGWIQEVVVNTTTGHIIDGHLRVTLAMRDGEAIPVKYVQLTEAEEKIALASMDPISALASQDQGMLDDLINDIGIVENQDLQEFLAGLAKDDDDDTEAAQEEARQSLAERFTLPPFSVLDAKQGYWKERKDKWLKLGIRSELGRGNEDDKTKKGLTFAVSCQPVDVYKFKEKVEAELGRKMPWAEFADKYPEEIRVAGTSIFDPVLTETMYTWFCKPGGHILDPFAGGSVRGVVAGFLGFEYTGIELRGEQVKANRIQGETILGKTQERKPAATIPAFRITEHNGIRVLRDDDVFGGTKRRVLSKLLAEDPAEEFVYATPAYGFAQVALAQAAADNGKKASIFVAKRNQYHPRTEAAERAGATIHECEAGYLNVTQARAKEYCEETGAKLVPFGLDTEEFIEALAQEARDTGENPSEVWTVAGSGVLTRALQRAWPDADFHAVQIGKEPDIGDATGYEAPEKFEDPAKKPPPFESCDNYDAKAWRFIEQHASPGALFWNVGGNIKNFDTFDQEEGTARWIEGDSRNVKELAGGEYDMVFSCPPYADLEVYSDNPADISTLGYDEFLAAYKEIIAESCALLKNNRFAVFVVGEVRTPKGGYHGFVQDTIKAFEEAGLTYYNECVLLTNIAANAMRAAGAFTNSRKLTKGHQNALVFAKGAPELHNIKGMSRAISTHFGDHREVFRAFENIMVFVKGDPKKATEAAGDAASIDLDGLALGALDE